MGLSPVDYKHMPNLMTIRPMQYWLPLMLSMRHPYTWRQMTPSWSSCTRPPPGNLGLGMVHLAHCVWGCGIVDTKSLQRDFKTAYRLIEKDIPHTLSWHVVWQPCSKMRSFSSHNKIVWGSIYSLVTSISHRKARTKVLSMEKTWGSLVTMSKLQIMPL